MGLFSTTHHHHTKTVGVPYEKNVTVNNHHAPTDESVKLLNEFQERAKQNIIEVIKLDENFVKAVIICYQDEFIQNRIGFYIKFELNGKEYILTDHVDRFEWRQELAIKDYTNIRYYVYQYLIKKYSEMIAKELLTQLPESILPSNFNL